MATESKPRFREVLKCEACGEEFPWGEGCMEAADAHEKEATLIDPEMRDHWVTIAQIELESARGH